MNSSLRKLFAENVKLTAWFCLIPLILTAIFWPLPGKWMALLGIVYGAALALCSLYMICIQSESLSGKQKTGKNYTGGYLARYLMYAVFLFIGAWIGIPILAMLIGAAASKVALFVYAKKDSDARQAEEDRLRELAKLEEEQQIMNLLNGTASESK